MLRQRVLRNGSLHSVLQQASFLSSERPEPHLRMQVCDFGLALTIEDAVASVRTDKRGTAVYAAPELLRNGSLCRSSDVYSFGMIAWHLVSAGSNDADMTDAQICYQACPLAHASMGELR